MPYLTSRDPHALGHGARVGRWRILERCDSGSYGAVYRAEREGHPEQGRFALKLALHPEDPRFGREVELLQRVVHRSAPRFEDSGEWMGPDGQRYPYVIMELIVTQKMKREREGRGQRDSPSRLGAVVASLPKGCAILAHHHLCVR